MCFALYSYMAVTTHAVSFWYNGVYLSQRITWKVTRGKLNSKVNHVSYKILTVWSIIEIFHWVVCLIFLKLPYMQYTHVKCIFLSFTTMLNWVFQPINLTSSTMHSLLLSSIYVLFCNKKMFNLVSQIRFLSLLHK